MAKIRVTRRLFQLFFLGGAISLLIRGLAGTSAKTVEYYCPMGGVVSIYGLLSRQQFICALNEMNVSIALAVLVGVIVMKKGFCSWVCPLGTIFESLVWVRKRVMGRDTLRVPDIIDRILVNLRYVVLGLILVFTFWTSELIFRGYDPFYILFTGGRGHGLIPVVSLSILGGVLAATFLFEMAWCRYLCPLGAVMTPLSRIGLLKVTRNDARCNGCGACDAGCLQRIPVSTLAKVARSDCTSCLDCVATCSRKGALDIGI
ncbi:MAG: 4Fe-4S binding protein [Candidatus Eisenbacteria bacterium]